MTKFIQIAFTAALLAPAAARAQVVTPQPPPTIITSQPYTISTPGYYQLGANLVSNDTGGDIITIASSNVTLDFAGHYISGPSTPNSSSQLEGVHATEKGNINIRNGTIAYCYRGIDLDGSGQSGSLNINQRVENMLVSYCSFEGVRINAATNSVVSNCRVSFTGNNTSIGSCYGIYAVGGGGNQILNNTITNTVATVNANSLAYAVRGSTDTAVISNLITNVTSPGTSACGIYICAFADHNKVYNATTGLYSATKYSDNLTVNCTTAFSGGAAVGNGNN